MRWRFIDRIDEIVLWRMARGCKAVSFEEAQLPIPLGRENVLPETLALESCVCLAQWLVARSSDFKQTCLLESVEGWRFERVARIGERLEIAINAEPDTSSTTLKLEAVAECDAKRVCAGIMTVQKVALDDMADPEAMRILWSELHGQS